jgi:hypothetical protein
VGACIYIAIRQSQLPLTLLEVAVWKSLLYLQDLLQFSSNIPETMWIRVQGLGFRVIHTFGCGISTAFFSIFQLSRIWCSYSSWGQTCFSSFCRQQWTAMSWSWLKCINVCLRLLR